MRRFIGLTGMFTDTRPSPPGDTRRLGPPPETFQVWNGTSTMIYDVQTSKVPGGAVTLASDGVEDGDPLPPPHAASTIMASASGMMWCFIRPSYAGTRRRA